MMISGLVLALSINYVIHISVDGLRPDAITSLDAIQLPNFYRLRSEGAFTDNARTDADHTTTLPNHTTILTGRGVKGEAGHNYTANQMPHPQTNLHSIKGAYVSSVFDVVHDRGGSTALFASKQKFVIYDQSYNADTGAIDTHGTDNGRDKIDFFEVNVETTELVADYLDQMLQAPITYTLLHLRDPDTAGHKSNWDITPGSGYLNSIVKIDGLLGNILSTIDTHPSLKDRTAIVLTSDHGGQLGTILHSDGKDVENYVIPFYVWGPGVAEGTDLYQLSASTRHDPKRAQPDYSSPLRPIHNGDSANLVLRLLGLQIVPRSTINAARDLRIH